MAKTEKEWQQFRVGKLSKRSNFTNSDCVPFSKISHIANFENGLNIFKKGTIKPALVDDVSLLENDRMLVTWLSPNYWDGAGGSVYGNICFNFDFDKLISGDNYYWLGRKPGTRIPTIRILVTEHNYNSRLQKYDPESGDGPWWFNADDEKHYRNSDISIHILFERDISLRNLISVEFVSEKSGMSQYEAGARFICALVGIDNDIRFTVKRRQNLIDNCHLKSILSFLWQNILFSDSDMQYTGTIESQDNSALPLAKAILKCCATADYDEINPLATFFKSKKSLKNSCAKLIGDCFNVPWQELI